MKLTPDFYESYRTYSEFKDSDWYIYWDKEFSKIRNYQLLVVWHIKADNYVYYDYVRLSELIKNGSAQNGLPYVGALDADNIKYFIKICNEFVADVDFEFDKNETHKRK